MTQDFINLLVEIEIIDKEIWFRKRNKNEVKNYPHLKLKDIKKMKRVYLKKIKIKQKKIKMDNKNGK